MSRPYILLVEDNADDVDLTTRAFEKNHIANEVVVMRDGAQARDFLFDGKRKSHMPALILLDLNLPKIGGLQLLELIRENENTRLLPTVILTSSKEEDDLIEGYRRGVNSYVRKPVDFNEFVEAVRQVGLYWLVLNEPPPNALGGGM